MAALYIVQTYSTSFNTEKVSGRVVQALLFTLCSTEVPLVRERERDKYSLRQTKINGWVQKCAEQQATEEDVATYKQPASATEIDAYTGK